MGDGYRLRKTWVLGHFHWFLILDSMYTYLCTSSYVLPALLCLHGFRLPGTIFPDRLPSFHGPQLVLSPQASAWGFLKTRAPVGFSLQTCTPCTGLLPSDPHPWHLPLIGWTFRLLHSRLSRATGAPAETWARALTSGRGGRRSLFFSTLADAVPQ